jgi:hypothetical protein
LSRHLPLCIADIFQDKYDLIKHYISLVISS